VSHRGFTLLETLLAATLLCLVVVAVLQLMPGSAFAARRAEHTVEAVSLGRSMLETMRAQPFAALDTYRGKEWCAGAEVLGVLCPCLTWPRPAASDGVQLVARCRVDAVAGCDPSSVLHLSASVRWADRAALRLPSELDPSFGSALAPGYREYLQELTIHAVGP
jgi:prepilin-type N-terminal cleavage/methylation domain-containing protein